MTRAATFESRAQPGSEANPDRPVTLADVADRANVSLSTASKALNGRDGVSPSTRSRVREAARRLGFSPSTVARSLATGRTNTVGLITHDLVGRFSIPLLMGIENAFGVNEVSVMLCDARGDSIREKHHLASMLERRVDGLVVVGARPDPRPSLGKRIPVPVVYAYAPSVDPSDTSIVADNVLAGHMATEHLIAQGKSHIAIIQGDQDYGASVDRAAGSLAALAEAGLELVGGSPLYGEWSEVWGRSATRALLSRDPAVDGIVCGNDQIARGALDYLRDHRVNVPGDVAVTGHDNWRVVVEGCRPGLTTIDMGLERIGRIAAKRLREAMEGHLHPGVEKIPGHLIVSGSTVA
ncbi:LacI family transcriptional regulator [Actinomyces sp. Z5]|uniref:LacI family DNA-binding transcriptional regulator n=1 Tax=Actinomyces sp. Z5 TaxID=2250216 RepID=UPI000DCCD249|nr:LacI family DNA-binding transcriptional regulator [Actinomyces sp. Z5]MBE6474570.1 LacI family transcriptional regulator [Actinomyces succiniciruminis]RAX23630.1 LacI family transcriptional regulator [Actinomyces sp. Z5]